MGIEPPYIGLYGVWSMVGIEVRGMAEAGCYWGVVWVGQWGYWSGWLEVQGISNPDCNTLLRQESCATQPVTRVLDDFPYLSPKTSRVVICDDFTCLTIRYHETDGSDAIND